MVKRLRVVRRNAFPAGFVAIILGIVVAVAAAGISQIPLYLTTAAPPNIMILLDNSGSMDTIMQHPAYDPNVEYPGSFRDGDIYYQTTSSGRHYLSTRFGNSISDDGTGVFFFTGNPNPPSPLTYDGRKVKLPLPYTNTRWDGRYLNWIFYHATKAQYDSLGTDPSLQQTRIQTARTVIAKLVKEVSGVRFGLSKFVLNGGGTIVAGCGALTAANVDATVNGIDAETMTPLGRALADVWSYFKGNASPIIAACQKNFVVVVTDGEPTYDGCYSGDFSLYGCNNAMYAPSRLVEVAGYMHSHDASATYENAQTVETYTVGLTIASDLLRNAAAAGGGAYRTADTADQLTESLVNIVSAIKESVSSATSIAINFPYISAASKVFRARFQSGVWIGFLEAFALEASGDIKGLPDAPLWEAASLLKTRESQRTIYTAGPVGGVYRRVDFTTAKDATLTGGAFMNFSTTKTATLIGYLRGDTSPSGYRVRSGKLGDIVYSSPVVVGPPSSWYTDNGYPAFKKAQAKRKSLVLVGANDGMLHAFAADNGFEEWAFIPNSLLPKLKLLRNDPYAHQNYVNGTITVGDAYIASKDANGAAVPSAWRTVAVCGLREGGRSFFAVDVTDPTNPVPLWEVTPSSPAVNSLGYSFGTPLIVKLRDSSAGGSRWVALLANGYEGTTNGASAGLLVVDLATGALVREIVVDASTNGAGYANGLSSPAAVDVDGNGYADVVYAGDLRGNLWKFDFSSADKTKWDSAIKKAGKPAPLFTATDDQKPAIPQPITSAPEVVLLGETQWVYVGTGKYFESTDIISTQVQSVCGVIDANTGDSIGKGDLVERVFKTVLVGLTDSYRVFPEEPSLGTKKGWYINFPAGERVITDPVARAKKLVFTTFLPNSASCSYGGSSWLMEVGLFTGGTPEKPTFDVNKDGVVTTTDTVTYDKNKAGKFAVGVQVGEGVAGSATTLEEYVFVPKTDGTIMKLLEGGGTSRFGMRSWRQL